MVNGVHGNFIRYIVNIFIMARKSLIIAQYMAEIARLVVGIEPNNKLFLECQNGIHKRNLALV